MAAGERDTSHEESFAISQQLWTENCSGVDEVLEEYRRDVNGEIESWIDDTPTRVLTWKGNGIRGNPIGFSISLMLETSETPALKIFAAQWQDDESTLKRNLVEISEHDEPVPVSAANVNAVIVTYGHVLRIFSGVAQNRDLHDLQDEIQRVNGPNPISFKIGQVDIPPLPSK